MSKIIVNAPVQNKEGSFDYSLGKVVPFYVAEYIRTHDKSFVTQQNPIHLWNDNTVAEQYGHRAESFRAQQAARLLEKYQSSSMHLFKETFTATYSDIDPDFVEWAQQEVVKMHENGTIAKKVVEAQVCNNCEGIIAHASSPELDCCSFCSSRNIAKRQVTALTTTFRSSMLPVAQQMGVNREDKQALYNNLINAVDTEFIVNKRRIAGIGLKGLDLPYDVLDPRIGVGLLSIYAALLESGNHVEVVVGRKNIAHNIPQFLGATAAQLADYPTIALRGIVRAPVNYLKALVEDGEIEEMELYSILLNKIVKQLDRLRKDMSPTSAEQLIYSKKP